MTWFYEFLHWLCGKMEEPHMLGWFHLMMVGIVIALTIVYIVLWRKADEKTYRKVIFWTWVFLVYLELLKQLTINFVTIGGLATLIYPEQALIDTIVINVQTLLYHGIMIVVGIFTAVWLGRRFNLKIFSKTPVPFLAFIVVAMILNITFVKSGITGGSTFNMFFISPYFPCTLPVLSEIYPVVPYPVFLLLYVLGFIALSFIFFEIVYWILWVIRKLAPHKEASLATEQQ